MLMQQNYDAGGWSVILVGGARDAGGWSVIFYCAWNCCENVAFSSFVGRLSCTPPPTAVAPVACTHHCCTCCMHTHHWTCCMYSCCTCCMHTHHCTCCMHSCCTCCMHICFQNRRCIVWHDPSLTSKRSVW